MGGGGVVVVREDEADVGVWQLWSNLIFKNSTSYLQPKPEFYPAGLKWPQLGEIVDSLAQMARLNWP